MSRTLRGSILILATALILALSAGLAIADPGQFSIGIGTAENVARGDEISIPVYKLTGPDPIQQLNITFQYDYTLSELLDITPGAIFDIPGAYEWEKFEYEEISFPGPVFDSMYPPPVIRFISVTIDADTVNEPHQPIELVFPDSTILFYLNFKITYNIAVTCNYIPIRFYWNECEHNSIIYGDPFYTPEIAISNSVFEDYGDMLIDIADSYQYPGFYGASNVCLDSAIFGIDNSERLIDFYNGHISISCDSSNEFTGDVNANGIAYEIADWVLFGNYFTMGADVFTISTDKQTSATDINGNMHPLGVDDYVYLHRIIDGDLGPGMTSFDSSSGVLFENVSEQGRILGRFDIPVTALYLVYYAPNMTLESIVPSSLLYNMVIDHSYRNDSLFIFVYGQSGNSSEATFSANYEEILRLNYSGTIPRLATVSASGYWGENIRIASTNNYFNQRGDVNLNGISFEIADWVVLTNYLLNGKTAFTIVPDEQFWAADINLNGLPAQADDYVYLLRIINGDMTPEITDIESIGYFNGDVYFVQTDSSTIIRADMEQNCGALAMSFYTPGLENDPEYSISVLNSGIEPYVNSNILDDTLRVLISIDFYDSTLTGVFEAGLTNLIEIRHSTPKLEIVAASASGAMAQTVSLNIIEMVEGEIIPFQFELSSSEPLLPGEYYKCELKKTAGNQEMNKFDFLISYDTSLVQLINVNWGDVYYNEYNWESFEVDYGPFEGCQEGCPSGILRMVGMQVPDGIQPSNDKSYIENDASLCSILFRAKYPETDTITPLQFYWIDCNSNVVSAVDGNGEFSAISNLVRSADGTLLSVADPAIPGVNGAANSCLESTELIRPQRVADFKNGQLEIIRTDQNPVEVSLGHLSFQPLGSIVNVPVVKTDGNKAISGFDFLIDYKYSFSTNGEYLSNSLQFIEVVPGTLFDNPGAYEWEYFNYRSANVATENPNLIIPMIHVVGLANINDGVSHQPSNYIANGTPLFRLVFKLSDDFSYFSNISLLRFYWQDCRDNTIAYGDPNGDSLAISAKVYDPFGMEITDLNSDFPSYTGAKYYCLDETITGDEITTRSIVFRNGYIEFEYVEEIDDRGDVNLNGIAYEIADYVVFTNYLIYGLTAFTVNHAGQLAAAEILPDGIAGDILDHTYMIAIIKGDYLPFPSPVKNNPVSDEILYGNIRIVDTDSSLLISTDFADSLGGLYFKYYYNDVIDTASPAVVKSDDLDSSIGFLYGIDNDTMKILITSDMLLTPTIRSAIVPGNYDLFEIPYNAAPPAFMAVTGAGYNMENVVIAVNSEAPAFDAYPSELSNNVSGEFRYQFGATGMEPFEFEIISGPGTINNLTGEYAYSPVCHDIGEEFEVEICVGNDFNSCAEIDPANHAVVQLNVTDQPPLLGDADNNGQYQILDIIFLINYLYKHNQEQLLSLSLVDTNADTSVNLLDITYLISYLFKSGPAPVCP